MNWNQLLLAAILLLPAATYGDGPARGTATIVQNLDYDFPGEDLDYQFAEGLDTIVPSEDTFGEIGAFGLSESCFDVPAQPVCEGTRIAPFDETLGTLVGVTLDFAIMDSITYGDFYLEGILNTSLPHSAGATITTDNIEWLIDTDNDADSFFVTGSPSFSFGVSCMGVPGDEDDCAGDLSGEPLNFGFGFTINQTWANTDPEWIGPNGIEHLFLSSNSAEIYLTIVTNSFISELSTDNISGGEISIEGVSVLGSDIQLVVTYEYEPAAGPDSDGDGIFDSVDNCTLAANPSQVDTNGDGYGNACDADVNNDGVINALDLGLFKAAFFSVGVTDTDFNADGATNAIDLGILKASFFGTPGPSGLAL